MTQDEAFKLGVEAFENGDIRLVPTSLILAGVIFAKQWYLGWDLANLAAPVPGFTAEEIAAFPASKELAARLG